MAGYYNNLALHISEATLKGRRRLTPEARHGAPWGYLICGLVGASALWAAALALF